MGGMADEWVGHGFIHACLHLVRMEDMQATSQSAISQLASELKTKGGRITHAVTVLSGGSVGGKNRFSAAG